MYAGGVRSLRGFHEVKDIDGRQGSTLSVSERVCGRRGSGCAWWGIHEGNSASVTIGVVLDVGTARDEGLGILMGAVLSLLLRFLLVFVEFPLIFLSFGDT
jgi:hypothetical protein